MTQKSIAVVGMGRLGTSLAQRLSEAGYSISKIASRKSRRPKKLRADVVWFCVPDAEIENVARSFSQIVWNGKYAFHSSGVLSSDSLASLRDAGAYVASVHPLMTFIKGSVPELKNVPFAIEGDTSAVNVARKIVRGLGGKAVAIRKKDKVAYHAFATMICPLLVALLTAAERTAGLAGIPQKDVRRRMMPILRQTLRNYEKVGPARAFSGPIVRGDVKTIELHLKVMATAPDIKDVYIALAQAALRQLPTRKWREIERTLAAESMAHRFGKARNRRERAEKSRDRREMR